MNKYCIDYIAKNGNVCCVWVMANNEVEAEAVAKVDDSGCYSAALLSGEHQTCGVALADADAKEVYFKTGLLFLRDVRIDLEHMALKDGCLVAVEIQGVVLEE